MTLYCTYQIVETPLNQEMEPMIRIRKRDLRRDPIQNRMLLILGFTFLAIIAFALFLFPVTDAAEESRSALDVRGSEPANVAVDTGVLSPVFSAEVDHWEAEILGWAAEHQLDPDIVATIMQIESCGDPEAVSSAGAQGLFQVMPFHFEIGEEMLNPEANAYRGLSYYNQQLGETGGDVFRSFAGYNGGSAASSSGWEMWAEETQRYYIWSKGIYEEAKAGLDDSPTLGRWMEAGGASLCHQASVRLGLN